jgi:hypothetical protein
MSELRLRAPIGFRLGARIQRSFRRIETQVSRRTRRRDCRKRKPWSGGPNDLHPSRCYSSWTHFFAAPAVAVLLRRRLAATGPKLADNEHPYSNRNFSHMQLVQYSERLFCTTLQHGAGALGSSRAADRRATARRKFRAQVLENKPSRPKTAPARRANPGALTWRGNPLTGAGVHAVDRPISPRRASTTTESGTTAFHATGACQRC